MHKSLLLATHPNTRHTSHLFARLGFYSIVGCHLVFFNPRSLPHTCFFGRPVVFEQSDTQLNHYYGFLPRSNEQPWDRTTYSFRPPRGPESDNRHPSSEQSALTFLWHRPTPDQPILRLPHSSLPTEAHIPTASLPPRHHVRDPKVLIYLAIPSHPPLLGS